MSKRSKQKAAEELSNRKLTTKSKGIPKDGYAAIEVAQGMLWGQQTQRALENFNIGKQRFDKVFIAALVSIKRACAEVNSQYLLLSLERREAILSACDEILAGGHADQFPLSVWQSGSGTQSNMNVNEVSSSMAKGY